MRDTGKPRTRFAPSPTGLLHVGNAYSALLCQQWAEQQQSELYLRIEDIDFTRCRNTYTQHIIEDLTWLGIHWHHKIMLQSQRHDAYRQALAALQKADVIYPCFCSRKAIQQQITRMASAPHHDDVTPLYPGTCHQLSQDERQQRMRHETFAWRMDMQKIQRMLSNTLMWQDAQGNHHPIDINTLDDVVIGRKDIAFSYHLAVVVDDAAQGISHIIRGKDLLDSTPIHRILQHLLKLPAPIYIHHPLLMSQHGERLAKRNHSTTLQSLRQAGCDASILRHFLMQATPPVWPFEQENPAQIISFMREQLGSFS